MFKEIKKLHKRGYRCVAGLDEAGRGPLAGPVVAAAAVIEVSDKRLEIGDRKLEKIKDSKKLSAKQREDWYKILTGHRDISWGVGVASEKVIDKINILEATKLAMVKAVRDLEKKLEYRHPEFISGSQKRCRNKFGMTNYNIDFLIIDGNFVLDKADWNRKRKLARKGADFRPLLQFKQKAIPKADEKIFLCAAASIIAKVTRDRIMLKMHKKYPQYGFDKHKGYGTKEHLLALRKHGPCVIHRKSFGPVRNSLLLQRRGRVDFKDKKIPPDLPLQKGGENNVKFRSNKPFFGILA